MSIQVSYRSNPDHAPLRIGLVTQSPRNRMTSRSWTGAPRHYLGRPECAAAAGVQSILFPMLSTHRRRARCSRNANAWQPRFRIVRYRAGLLPDILLCRLKRNVLVCPRFLRLSHQEQAIVMRRRDCVGGSRHVGQRISIKIRPVPPSSCWVTIQVERAASSPGVSYPDECSDSGTRVER